MLRSKHVATWTQRRRSNDRHRACMGGGRLGLVILHELDPRKLKFASRKSATTTTTATTTPTAATTTMTEMTTRKMF